MMKVLVIDDEPQIRRALKIGLERNGYVVQLAATGAEGLEKMGQDMPELVVLDLALPGLDGFEVCRQIRTWSSVPIIILSVRASEEDKIKALDCGADDYLAKPFGVGELLARMRAIIRRTKPPEKTLGAPIFSEGALEVDLDKRLVHKNGELLHLTPKEYELLSLLINNPNRVLTHRQLLTKVWGAEYAEDHHSLRVHIANLRNKIEGDPARPAFIQTETRIGYRFASKNF